MHMSTILFSYWTTYKVGTSHTPFQLVYELHPLLPTEYILPFKFNDDTYPQPIRVLTSWLFELEKLQENVLIARDLVTSN
jgi:hypothetical protein